MPAFEPWLRGGRRAAEGDKIVEVNWKHWDKEMLTLIQALSRFRDEAV